MSRTALSLELVIAAKLTDPDTRQQLEFNQSTDWLAVLANLTINKIPLMSLTHGPRLSACPLLTLSAFREQAEKEAATWNALRDEYALVREGLMRHGIHNILIKSVGLAPSFPYTSDNLDVLVRSQHIEAARCILNDLRYVELRNIEEPQKFLFRKFQAGKSVSAIHLHGLAGWGVPFMDEESLWAGCRVSPDDPLVVVPSPEDGLLITMAHAFYENKSFKLLDLVRIRHCLRQGKLDFDYMVQVAKVRGWVDGLYFSLLLCARLEDWLYGESLIPRSVREQAGAAIAASSWLLRRLESSLEKDEITFPFRVSFLFGKVLYYRKILVDQERSVLTRLVDVVRTLAWGIKLKLHISGQRGMLVSFSGIDGSGKTVHARALINALAISEIRARYFWGRIGASGWIGWLGRAVSGKRDEGTVRDTASALAGRRLRLRHPFVRLGWLVFNLADLIFRYAVRVRLSRLLGNVVVCDRYNYDATVEISASLPGGSSWADWTEWLLVRLCPHPHVAWLLDVPAEVSAVRQLDEAGNSAAQEELENQRAKFLVLAKRCALIVVDTRIGQEETTSRVVHETLRRYYEDYGTWVNALLLSNPSQLNG
jgi:thymidylate kinase